MAFELDTKALRYFVAVAKYKSFTLAAAHLRLTQPAITRQIQAIERDFGVRLFRRQGRQMLLSEAGQVLHEQAKDILERIDSAGKLVKESASEPTGRLSIGAPTATGEIYLPTIVASFQKKYPKVFVHVVTGYTGDLAEMLAVGKLDLALIVGTPSHGDLDLQPLIDLELGFLAPAESVMKRDPTKGKTKISLAQAAALPLVFPSKAQTLRIVVEQACKAIDVVPNIVLESDSLGISKALVKTGLGYMFLGSGGAIREVRDGELRYLSLIPPAINWQLSLATRRGKANSLATRLMIKEIVDAIH